MKSIILALATLLYGLSAHAQFTAVGGVLGAYNLDKDFDTFREAYNKTNQSRLSKELDDAHVYKGASVEINYRILKFVGSLGRSYMSTGSKVKFGNGAARYFDMRYQFTNVFFGLGFDMGERSEIRFEIGLTHSLSDLYSFVKLPTGELDYSAGGISIQSTHAAIAYSGRISYYQGLTDKISLNFSAQFTSAKANNLDIEPHILYEGIAVTHTFKGPLLHFGIAYKLSDRVE